MCVSLQLSAHADFSVWALFFFCPSLYLHCLSFSSGTVHWVQ
nr:MAG TPA: hypothetical protein [Caudoviricetes sp.]